MYFFLFFVAGLSFTNAKVQTETVSVICEIECNIDGVLLKKETFTDTIPIKIYVNSDGSDFWGVGDVAFNYQHPAFTTMRIFNPQKISMKLPYKYAFDFSTMIKVAPGVHWGDQSSIIYVNSFQDFSPIYNSGTVRFGEDDENFCRTNTLISPTSAL